MDKTETERKNRERGCKASGLMKGRKWRGGKEKEIFSKELQYLTDTKVTNRLKRVSSGSAGKLFGITDGRNVKTKVKSQKGRRPLAGAALVSLFRGETRKGHAFLHTGKENISEYGKRRPELRGAVCCENVSRIKIFV